MLWIVNGESVSQSNRYVCIELLGQLKLYLLLPWIGCILRDNVGNSIGKLAPSKHDVLIAGQSCVLKGFYDTGDILKASEFCRSKMYIAAWHFIGYPSWRLSENQWVVITWHSSGNLSSLDIKLAAISGFPQDFPILTQFYNLRKLPRYFLGQSAYIAALLSLSKEVGDYLTRYARITASIALIWNIMNHSLTQSVRYGGIELLGQLKRQR